MDDTKYSEQDQITYLNGLLSSMAILNLTPNSGKHYGFADINSNSSDLTESLRIFLKTPKWNFEFIKLNGDWKNVALKESSWAFTNIIMENCGHPFDIGIEKHEEHTKKFNLDHLQGYIFSCIESILEPYKDFEVYKVEILSIEPEDYSGYFAHGESNYLFKTVENKMFLLFLRASD